MPPTLDILVEAGSSLQRPLLRQHQQYWLVILNNAPSLNFLPIAHAAGRALVSHVLAQLAALPSRMAEVV